MDESDSIVREVVTYSKSCYTHVIRNITNSLKTLEESVNVPDLVQDYFLLLCDLSRILHLVSQFA